MPSKYIDDAVYDGALDDIEAGIAYSACAMGGSANNWTNMNANQLGELVITTANFTGPADGDVDGRKLTKDADDIPITVGGTADVVAIHDNVSLLLALTTLASSVVVANLDTLQVAAWDTTLRDAA